MKSIVCLSILLLFFTPVIAQTAYIQVNGEPGLSVYLDGEFRGKTTAEYNGYIIENVSAGKHLIRIVKEGYVPFEETITVKKGEVLAYKVKPFSKHVIKISETGNTDATDTKVDVVTGKLIIQSVPIEIKITIKNVEGATLVPKTKDEWIADEIPEGNYEVKFTFNNKVIEKTVEIIGKSSTRVFVNMMNGEFTTTNSSADRVKVLQFHNNLPKEFYFQPNISRQQFLQHHPELASLKIKSLYDASALGFPSTSYFIDGEYYQKKRKTSNSYLQGFIGYITDSENKVVSSSWNLESDNASITELEAAFERIRNNVRSKVPAAYWRELNDSKYGTPMERIIITVPDAGGNALYYIVYKIIKDATSHNISLSLVTKKNLAEW